MALYCCALRRQWMAMLIKAKVTWGTAVEMQRVTMLRHRTDMSRRGTVWYGMAKVP